MKGEYVSYRRPRPRERLTPEQQAWRRVGRDWTDRMRFFNVSQPDIDNASDWVDELYLR